MDYVHELAADARLLGRLPVAGFGQVGLRFGAGGQLPAHFFARRRSRRPRLILTEVPHARNSLVERR
jgi:hypothetical protein